MGNQSLHRVMFLRPPFLAPKGPWALPGPRCGFRAPKMGPGSKISKLRIEKPCRIQWSLPQTGPYVASYGPKPFWGGGSNFLGGDPFPLGNPSAPGATLSALGATPLPLGQPLCAWGNPVAPGSNPLLLGQSLCPTLSEGSTMAFGLHGPPLGVG